MDMFMISASLGIIGVHAANYANGLNMDWGAKDTYVGTAYQEGLCLAERILFSLLIWVGWLKLFDYLSAFHAMFGFTVMLERMISGLQSIFIVLMLVVSAFASSEFVAYGFRDDRGFTWLTGWIARFTAIFSQDPNTFAMGNAASGHSDVARVLGSMYTLLFALFTLLLVINLIIAILTDALEKANDEGGDVLAVRQWDTLEEFRITRRAHLELFGTKQHTTLEKVWYYLRGGWIENFDRSAYTGFEELLMWVGDVWDRHVAAPYYLKFRLPKAEASPADPATAPTDKTALLDDNNKEAASSQG